MDADERITGTRDEQYNLISVLYHALHGAETVEAYVLDAEATGDERLATFFREAQATQAEIAERAKELLGIVTEVMPEAGAMPGAASLETEATPVDVRGRTTPEMGLPPEGEGPLGAEPPVEEVPPLAAEAQREPNVPADEPGVTAEDVPPATEVLRTPNTTPLPDEDLIAETRGVVPEGAPGEAPSERPTGEAPWEEVPGEPARATQEQREAGQPEGKQEKGLVDRAKGALTDREEPDR